MKQLIAKPSDSFFFFFFFTTQLYLLLLLLLKINMNASSFSFLLVVSLFLVLQPWSFATSTTDFLAPILEDVCNEVKCGKGICKPSENSTVPFECECSRGWKQLASDDHHNLKFLPCVIPNCTFDYSCWEAAAPVQEKEKRGNESIFDVCRWVDCGGGECETTSLFTHKCECSQGYHNLLNLTFSPCLKQCSLGMDCKDLDIGFSNKSTSSPPPSLPPNGSNRGNYRVQGSFEWLIFTMAFLELVHIVRG